MSYRKTAGHTKNRLSIYLPTLTPTLIPSTYSAITSPCFAIASAIHLPPHQQAADELGGNGFGRAGEEGLGEVLGERGGYGSGLVRECWGLRDPGGKGSLKE